MAATRVEQLRKLAKALSQDGKLEVTSQALCAELGVTDVETKALVRRSITHMVRHGELERIASGRFLYKAGAAAAMERAGESFRRPYPPAAPEDIFSKLRNAANRLNRMMMEPNPDVCREGILAECRAIVAHFEEEGRIHAE